MKNKTIEHANVREALTNAERELRKLVHQAQISLRTGRTATLTPTYVSIVSGHGLSAVRHAKHLLGLPTIEPRTPQQKG
jgi:hypothetical protein